jgi:hypothetical protein
MTINALVSSEVNLDVNRKAFNRALMTVFLAYRIGPMTC